MMTTTEPMDTEMLQVSTQDGAIRYVYQTGPRPRHNGVGGGIEEYLTARKAWDHAREVEDQIRTLAWQESEDASSADLRRMADAEYRRHVDSLAEGLQDQATVAAVRADEFSEQAERAEARARVAAAVTSPEVFATLPDDVRAYIAFDAKRHLENCGEEQGECSSCVLILNTVRRP